MLAVATANVNGVRAAVRRGMGNWLDGARPDILAVQEVRAPGSVLTEALPGWALAHEVCEIPGRAGVAVATKGEVSGVRAGLGLVEAHQTGRWIEADVVISGLSEPLTVVSAYVPVGELDSPKQAAKYAFLDAMTKRMGELAVGGGYAIVCGDINVAHREADLRNWRGNIAKRGFLLEERAYIDTWVGEQGWTDVGRVLAGAVDGPYTWWSWRGKAFDNDAGWRIDCQFATPGIAALAQSAHVDRAPSYAERWSDHAPLVVTYG
ncbi:MAG: endonuclease/exonuclease/phosphatase family protein [Bifidobacteriaceae bacterium]|jgi:exodeoxyribonuclease-3|nr:endonuclease/exonuclease/phosphatase family protein [Bifidobacteriaceae bacterium]